MPPRVYFPSHTGTGRMLDWLTARGYATWCVLTHFDNGEHWAYLWPRP